MYKRIAVLMGVVVLMMVSTLGQESSNAKTLPAKPIKKKTTDKKAPTIKEKLNVAHTLKNSLVVVEVSLKYDKGEAPPYRGEEHIEEERPIEIPGFLLSPTNVIAPDPLIHPRFVKNIKVRYGKELVGATVTSYAQDQGAIYLTLEKELPKTEPLKFYKNLKKPFLSVRYRLSNGEWGIVVGPLGGHIAVSKKESYRGVASKTLITNSKVSLSE